MKKYDLCGVDGNAYSVMGYVTRAVRKEGRSQIEINSYLKDAQSADYDHLLATSVVMIDTLNEE